MFLVDCHLRFSGLTQTVVGEDGTDLYTFCSLDEGCWCQGEGVQRHGQLFATNLWAKKAERTPSLPRKQLPFYTERRYALGLVHCWIPGVGCFFISEVNLKGSWAVAAVFRAILEICSYCKRLQLKHEWPAPQSSKQNTNMFAKRLVWAWLLVNSLNTSKNLIVTFRF